MIRRLLAPLAALWLGFAPDLATSKTVTPPAVTSLANGVSGQLPIANGGTGQTSLAAAGLPVLIQQLSLAGVNSVTFSSIPNTYKDLQVRYRGAGAASASFANVELQFNGDSGSNYDTQESVINNTTNTGGGSVAQNVLLVGYLPAASGVANLGGGGEINIFDYTGTSYFKEVTAVKGVRLTGVASGFYAGSVWGSWRSTSAITSITVLLSSGNGATTATVSLYGVP